MNITVLTTYLMVLCTMQPDWSIFTKKDGLLGHFTRDDLTLDERVVQTWFLLVVLSLFLLLFL